jgi:acyl-CoA thioesterase-2
MRHVLDQLALVQAGDTRFTAPPSEESHIRSYGGQIVAQALVAAGKTVAADRPCHSLHGYFLRPGNTDADMHFDVDTVRDGRSFSMRQVTATQNGKQIFSLMASFHTAETGGEHHGEMPDVPAPESLPAFAERFAGRESHDDVGRWFDRTESFDLRFAGPSPLEHEPAAEGASRYWVRFKEPVPDDPRLHQALIAYVSDQFILDPILLQHGRKWTDSTVIGASLDHAMWFHRELDATQWLLFDQESPTAAHSRGVARAQVWTLDGRLVVSLIQEALLRPPHSRDTGK